MWLFPQNQNFCGKFKAVGKCAIKISDFTNFDEILGGRVKTLHPKIYSGILNIRKNKTHQKELKKNDRLLKTHLKILRPCPKDSISPFEIEKYIGKKLKRNIKKNNLITKSCLSS